jgi:P-type conjugative transfer protein TrbG
MKGRSLLTETSEIVVLVVCALGLFLVLVLTGCSSTRPPAPPPPVPPSLVEAKHVKDPEPQPLVPPAETQLVPADAPELQAAMDAFLKTGKPPVLDHSKKGYVVFPYGHSQPVVRCRPLEVCDIQLQEGEETLDVAIGDSERWVAQPLRVGPPERRTMHVLLKPTDFIDLQTTVVIGTNRRVYHLKAISRTKGAIVSARWYYPQDLVAQWNTQQQANHAATQHVAATLPAVSLEHLDDRYEIAGNAPWRPVWVANDRSKTYLRLSPAVAHMELPAVFVEAPDGENALVNYRVRANFIVLDRVADRIVLTHGVGSDKQTVTVTRVGH